MKWLVNAADADRLNKELAALAIAVIVNAMRGSC